MINILDLDYQKTLIYFIDNLQGTNQLSIAVLEKLNFDCGSFYALLPDSVSNEDRHLFHVGGKTESLRNQTSEMIENILKANKTLVAVFDDVTAQISDLKNDNLYEMYGYNFHDQIYYIISGEPSAELISRCLINSDAIWHSLTILSDINPSSLSDHELNKLDFIHIVQKAQVLILGAYDAESYVFWVKNKSIIHV